MKYTQGEWYLHNNKPFLVVTKKGAICDMKNTHHEESEANARLIAASPDLYEALELVFTKCPSLGVRPDSELYKTIMQALKKANP